MAPVSGSVRRRDSRCTTASSGTARLSTASIPDPWRARRPARNSACSTVRGYPSSTKSRGPISASVSSTIRLTTSSGTRRPAFMYPSASPGYGARDCTQEPILAGSLAHLKKRPGRKNWSGGPRPHGECPICAQNLPWAAKKSNTRFLTDYYGPRCCQSRAANETDGLAAVRPTPP